MNEVEDSGSWSELSAESFELAMARRHEGPVGDGLE